MSEMNLFACDLTALSEEQRTTHQAVAIQLFGSLLRETRELPDGFAYRFDAEHYQLVAAFIANERQCCPFFAFTLEVAPHGGPVWLQLTAEGDVKPFLRAELGQLVIDDKGA
ncbi:MAG TPA: hypothetical protein VGD69_27520 [Herpetosiphonaceae bacterium]